MPFYVRNKTLDHLLFRGGHIQVSANGQWMQVAKVDVEAGLFEPMVIRGFLDLKESDGLPTDVLELNRPELVLGETAEDTGLSEAEFLAAKNKSKESATGDISITSSSTDNKDENEDSESSETSEDSSGDSEQPPSELISDSGDIVIAKASRKSKKVS